jgi:hypothetical protein
MKKTLLFAFALLFATATMAQNRAFYINESFDGASIPAGWSAMGLGTSNWSISNSNNAGGQPRELHLSWEPQFNGMSRFVSPAVDLTGVSSVIVSFKHGLSNYSGSNQIGVATTSDGGTTWNQAWVHSYNQSTTYQVEETISTPDMGNANVQFCIFFNGNSYNINDWYFDDIQIFSLENLDLGLNAIDLDNTIPCGDVAIGLKVKSFGETTITSVEATYQVEGFDAVTETFDVNIGSLETTILTFNNTIGLVPGDYNISCSINLVNGQEDDIADNNDASKSFVAAIGTAERFPMIEHFTSSTCPPCVNVNNQMLTFSNNNAGRFTYTKYQMNWPGSGDPYYTAEGGVRRTYYNVSAVPSIFLDGESVNTGAVTQASFDQHAARPAFMDIKGSFNVEGNTIHVIADVMPYIETNAHVYITVNEKLTTGNVGTNGETSFRHVMMKMLPNGQGSTITFVPNELQRLEFTQDMSSTHVEEMSDLEVSIFVQNSSKEVYNSHYAYEYTDIHPYPIENLTFVPNESNLVASWDAPAEGTPIGYNVYVNGQLVGENITETNYTQEGDPNSLNVLAVEAVYQDNMVSVKSYALAEATLQDLGLITEVNNFMLDEVNPTAEVTVTNANNNSQSAINILSIEEENEDDVQYLTIISEELPYALDYGENFSFAIEPNELGQDRSIAQTTIILTSDAGELVFNVEVDGILLNVNEVSAQTMVYPNPANNQVRIESANGIESVMVFDMMGVLVETIPANSTILNVNLSKYSEGTYFFNIRQSDGTVSNQRVVVNH